MRRILLTLLILVVLIGGAQASQYASQFDFLLSGVTNGAGNVCAGCTVGFYNAGTSETVGNKNTVWNDRLKASPATNPSTLDSLGTAQIYGDGWYLIVIRDSLGSIIYTRDYVQIGTGITQNYGQITTVSTYASLTAAVTAIGSSTPTDLIIDLPTTITANTVVPKNIHVVAYKAGMIALSGFNLTFNGNFDAGNYQSFSGTGAVSGISSTIPQWWGAKGDGVADDVTAIQAAINASSNISLPCGTYNISAELLLATATGNIYQLEGAGDCSVINITGTNKGIHVTGTAGVGYTYVGIQKLAITSTSSGTSSAAFHLDGIAGFSIKDIWIQGNNKITNGYQLTGAQQGEISGGLVTGCVNGGKIEESSGGVGSNGIDMHGITFTNNTTTGGLLITGQNDIFFRGNHVTGLAGQAYLMDLSNTTGLMVVANNHLEPVVSGNNGVIVRLGKAYLSGNSFYSYGGGTDLTVAASATGVKAVGNLMDGNITVAAGASDTVIAYNSIGGTVTDGGTRTMYYDNFNFSGTGLDISKHYNAEDITPLFRVAAGDILTLNGNGYTSGAWGMSIHGTGTGQDVYLRLNDVAVCGNTATGVLNIKSAPNGTTWASFSATGLTQGTVNYLHGAGVPSGTLCTSGNLGSLYSNTSGGAGTSLYVCEVAGAWQSK